MLKRRYTVMDSQKQDDPVSDVLDQIALNWIMMYYWPYFLAGNADNFKEIGRMYRPMCFR